MSSATHADAESPIDPALAVRLVLGVARLGEKDLAGWWSSQGLNPDVRPALAGFRRTGQVVGAELALLSAERRHRQLLPRANALHLFSPLRPYLGWAKAELGELKSAGSSALLAELEGWSTVEEAITGMRPWMPAGTTTRPAAHDDQSEVARLVQPYLVVASAGRQLEAEDIDHGERVP
ncbi:MAG: BrxE family protein [Acidimicrobiales bacterium]